MVVYCLCSDGEQDGHEQVKHVLYLVVVYCLCSDGEQDGHEQVKHVLYLVVVYCLCSDVNKSHEQVKHVLYLVVPCRGQFSLLVGVACKTINTVNSTRASWVAIAFSQLGS